MTTAIIGTGGIGSVIARQLASGGETLRLSSADNESARMLAAEIGRTAVVAVDNRDALQGADAVVLALRFAVLKGVIDEIADPLTDKLVVAPSNPLGIDAQGNVSRLLPKGQSSGEVLAGWSPAGARLAMAFGTLSAGLFESSSNRSPAPAVLFRLSRNANGRHMTGDHHGQTPGEQLCWSAPWTGFSARTTQRLHRVEAKGSPARCGPAG